MKALAVLGIAVSFMIGWLVTFVCVVNAFPLPEEF